MVAMVYVSEATPAETEGQTMAICISGASLVFGSLTLLTAEGTPRVLPPFPQSVR